MNKDVLDNASITDHQVDESFSHGLSFGLNILIGGYAGILASIGIISAGGIGFIIGPLILFGSTYIVTSTNGIDISYSTNYVRQYSGRFGYKTGKWLPLAAFSDLVILKITRTQNTTSRTGGSTTELDASKNEVYFMTHDHRRRLLFKICNSYEEAAEFAKYMSEKLNKRLVKFNPKLSEKTKRRLGSEKRKPK